jgi:hypothetical protein
MVDIFLNFVVLWIYSICKKPVWTGRINSAEGGEGGGVAGRARGGAKPAACTSEEPDWAGAN